MASWADEGKGNAKCGQGVSLSLQHAWAKGTTAPALPCQRRHVREAAAEAHLGMSSSSRRISSLRTVFTRNLHGGWAQTATSEACMTGFFLPTRLNAVSTAPLSCASAVAFQNQYCGPATPAKPSAWLCPAHSSPPPPPPSPPTCRHQTGRRRSRSCPGSPAGAARRRPSATAGSHCGKGRAGGAELRGAGASAQAGGRWRGKRGLHRPGHPLGGRRADSGIHVTFAHRALPVVDAKLLPQALEDARRIVLPLEGRRLRACRPGGGKAAQR